MPDDGYAVVTQELHDHAKNLDGKKAVTAEITDLVGRSDVGNQSWGIVGIFVKGKYTEMLGDLRDLITEMENGLGVASAKFTKSAQTYDEIEKFHKKGLQDILDVLNS